MKRTPWFSLLVFILVVSLRTAVCAETNHNFGKRAEEIANYESSDKTNVPPRHGWLITGASTIERSNTPAQDCPKQTVINRGVGGSEVVDITHFADRIVFPYEPKMIFFRSGGNDIHNGKSVEQVFADYKEFAALVHSKLL